LRNQFHAGVEMEDLREARAATRCCSSACRSAILIPFRLRLHAKFVAFERNAGTNRIMQLLLIVL